MSAPKPADADGDAAPLQTGDPVVFSLWHLFVLTAGVGVSMAAFESLSHPYKGMFSFNPWWKVAFGVVFGVALGGSVILVVERVRGRRSIFEPGHAFLFIGTLFAARQFVRSVGSDWMLSDDTHLAISCSASAVLGFALIACAVFTCPNLYWRVLFVAWSFPALFESLMLLYALTLSLPPSVLMSAYGWQLQYSPLIGTIAISVFAFADLRRAPRPDWLHWLGLSVAGANCGADLYLNGI